MKAARKAVYVGAYWFARGYWRLADFLDKIPGFNEGTEAGYNRKIEREAKLCWYPWHDNATAPADEPKCPICGSKNPGKLLPPA